MLQHLHDPLHGWGWTLFFLAPGGHRVGDYFVPGDVTDVDDAVAAAKRRLDVQHAEHRRHTADPGLPSVTHHASPR